MDLYERKKETQREGGVMRDRSNNKKYWVYGIIGCVCFGLEDWILGYVDPAQAGTDLFYFIRAGHGADDPAGKAQ